MGSSFGLDRHVTMNALVDVVGGPPEFPGPPFNPHMRLDSQETAWDIDTPQLKATMVNDFDELELTPEIDSV